jgi:hypothetical protein
MTMHKQVEIAAGGHKAEVDEELAPVIQALWRAGIGTRASCQEWQPGRAWILFPGPGAAKRFLDLVVEDLPGEDDPTFYDRALRFLPVPDDELSAKERLYERVTGDAGAWGWEYSVRVEDDGATIEEDGDDGADWVRRGDVGTATVTRTGSADFRFQASVYFPRTDIPFIAERLRAEARATAACAPSEGTTT